MSLLPAFAALLEEANVTRAAAREGVSQPSMTAKLARLRDLTGDALLVPSGSGRGMVLTPRAALMRPTILEALATSAAALRGFVGFDPVTSQATLRIIASDNAATLVAATLLADLAATGARGLRIRLLGPGEAPVARRLERGDADFAIATATAVPGAKRLHRHLVLTDALATAQRKGHPRGTAPLGLDDFCAADHLLVESGHGAFQRVVDDALARLGRTRRVALSCESYALAPMIAARSDLMVTLPRLLLTGFGDRLDLFDPPLPLKRFTVFAMWHDRTHHDPVNLWVRSQLFAALEARQREEGA